MLHVPLCLRGTPASRATRHRDPSHCRDDSGEDRVGRTAPPLTIFGSDTRRATCVSPSLLS